MNEKLAVSLTGVPETLLIPLYHRALETQRLDAMLKDEKAVEIVNKLNFGFSRFKLQKHDVIGLVCRVREFDRFARDFLTAHPDGVVVHLGCGLDTRFDRVDNGRVEWFDLDLPEVIQLRRQLIDDEGGRYHLLACSALDPAWMVQVSALRPRPFLFIAEGVLPYFEEEQVKWLVKTLQSKFPNSDMVFDAHTPWVVWGDNLQLMFSKISARLRFGLKHGRDVEVWSPNIRMLEEWHYYGTDEPRVRPYRLMIPFHFSDIPREYFITNSRSLQEIDQPLESNRLLPLGADLRLDHQPRFPAWTLPCLCMSGPERGQQSPRGWMRDDAVVANAKRVCCT